MSDDGWKQTIYREQRARTLALSERLINLGLTQQPASMATDDVDYRIDTDGGFWTIAPTQEGIEKLISLAEVGRNALRAPVTEFDDMERNEDGEADLERDALS